jgi:hypothetical protein
MDEENSILKNALCVKEHEIYSLRSELEKRTMELQSMHFAIERMERTVAMCFDRLIRRLERVGAVSELGKRRRR